LETFLDSTISDKGIGKGFRKSAGYDKDGSCLSTIGGVVF
jgi:hypothetical protein